MLIDYAFPGGGFPRSLHSAIYGRRLARGKFVFPVICCHVMFSCFCCVADILFYVWSFVSISYASEWSLYGDVLRANPCTLSIRRCLQVHSIVLTFMLLARGPYCSGPPIRRGGKPEGATSFEMHRPLWRIVALFYVLAFMMGRYFGFNGKLGRLLFGEFS